MLANMRRIVFFISWVLSFALLAPMSVWAVPFEGIAHDVQFVRAEDGASLALYHLKGNENGPVILLEPGIVETAEMLDGFAAAFHKRGYDVYIGQVRLAGRGLNQSGKSVLRNGLPEVTLYDFPAHLREVIKSANGRKINLLGHSMGGIEILATMSDSRLAAEFTPYLASATILASPDNMKDLPWAIRLQIKMIMPALRVVHGILRNPTLDPHVTFFDATAKLKKSSNLLLRSSAMAIEAGMIKLATLILNHTLVSVHHTTPEALRRIWFKEVSPLPLDLLMDFGEGTVNGEFLRHDGTRLVRPEKFNLPVQIISAERDLLAPVKQQSKLFENVGSSIKRMVTLEGLLHVDPVVADRLGWGYLSQIIDFHDNPEQVVNLASHVRFSPNLKTCEKVLLGP